MCAAGGRQDCSTLKAERRLSKCLHPPSPHHLLHLPAPWQAVLYHSWAGPGSAAPASPTLAQSKVCLSSRAPSTLAAPSPFHAGLTWDSGASISLLINGVKLLNEKYFILPFLQQQRHCSEQPWDVLLHARGGSAVRARTRIRRSQGWTRAWNSQDCWDCPGAACRAHAHWQSAPSAGR